MMPLYAHQREALNKMHGKDAFALLMGMRTGKTRVLIEDWAWVSNDSRDLLVIAPAGVYRTWEAELKKWMPEDIYYTVGVWESGNQEAIEDVADLIDSVKISKSRRVLLMNAEALSTVDAAR